MIVAMPVAMKVAHVYNRGSDLFVWLQTFSACSKISSDDKYASMSCTNFFGFEGGIQVL